MRWGALERVRDQSVVPLVSRTSARYSVEARRRTGDATLLATYETVGTIFAVVHSLAVATAKVDWHLYRPAKSGIKEDRTEVTTHAALDLWRMPNKFMPRRRFLETAQQHVDLTGESDILTSSIRLRGQEHPAGALAGAPGSHPAGTGPVRVPLRLRLHVTGR
jgi:phage portal protein BeeE